MASVTSNITTALGIGSGIDTRSLVSSLVAATRDPKEKVITDRQSLNSARISALASASSSLDTFADALTTLLSGTGYAGVPASNDTSIASVSPLPGGAASAVGEGELTLTVGGSSAAITIDASNNSYTGLAAAINASGLGVTASVVTDVQGTRLVMKGATGAANDFSLTSVSGDDLAAFAWTGTDSLTMESKASPQNAIIKLDGVEQHYATNTIDTAIANLRIDLNKAAPGTTVTLATTEPTTSMRDLMVEFVDAYNTLVKALNTATATGADSSSAGVLNGEASIRDMRRQLSAMTSTPLSDTGTYRTLSDIGVATNRDGTLKLDTDTLDKAIAADPSAITQLLNPAVASATNPGLAGLMDSVRDKIQLKDGSFAQSQAKYKTLGETLTKQLEKLDTQMASYEAQLTSVYSKMETRLTALKATQSYLDQQIEIWNNSKN